MWAKVRTVGNVYPRCPRAAPVRASASCTCPQPCCASAGLAASAGACGCPPEQRLAGFVELLGSLHVGQCPSELLQLQQRDASPQEVCRVRQAGQLVQRRHRIARTVHTLDAPRPVRVGCFGGEQAWPVTCGKLLLQAPFF